MKYFFVIAILLTVNVSSLLAEAPSGWSADFMTVMEEAKNREQPVLLYFTAHWCGPCKLLANTTFADENMQKALGNLNHVAVDIDQHPDLAKKYNIHTVPAFQMILPDGNVVASTSGYQEVKVFMQWVAQSITEATEAIARHKHSAEKLASAQQLLNAADAESKSKAAAKFLELCAEQEKSIVETAMTHLTALAESNPALLIDGLNSPRLVIRIIAANLLRARLGEEFDADPWSNETARLTAISIWREKLARIAPAVK